MSAGELPHGYLQTINAIAVSAGAYSQRDADLITELLDHAATWRLHVGWRPFRRLGGVEGGFGLITLANFFIPTVGVGLGWKLF
jgi:hypothetical protein